MKREMPAGMTCPADDEGLPDDEDRGEMSPFESIAPIPKKGIGKASVTAYRDGWKEVKVYRCPLCQARCSDPISLSIHVRFCNGRYPP
jgi:hypothetical protein